MRAISGFLLESCLILSCSLVVSSSAVADPVEEALTEIRENSVISNIEPGSSEPLQGMGTFVPNVDASKNPPAGNDMEKASSNSGKSENSSTKDGDSPDLGQKAYPGVTDHFYEINKAGVPPVQIHYPSFGNQKVDSSLKKYAESLAESFVKEVNPEDSSEEDESMDRWELSCFYTLDKPNPEVVSVVFDIYSYTGGAHGSLLVDVQNYDLKTGAPIELSDLFADTSKALQLLSVLCAEKLRSRLGDDVEEEMLRDGTEPTLDNFSNLALLPGGVAVEFQPYQVGPWSIGQQRVEITLDELKDAKPNINIWPALAS